MTFYKKKKKHNQEDQNYKKSTKFTQRVVFFKDIFQTPVSERRHFRLSK